MDDSTETSRSESGDKEIVYSRTIRAGKRIYYMDVKRNLKDDLFLAITESKKVQKSGVADCVFEKHKIFLYKEDFDKFVDNLACVIDYIKEQNRGKSKISEE
ncbi:MAG: PUR family DNA/RNA-binding protein [Tannerellaceae bacterium]|jgi:hypothetical protein|nr:PUR family DNA/RNA-binding protein [Tannerellaceae bacterium]